MNASTPSPTNDVMPGCFADTGENCILGPTYPVWRRLQHGQEGIVRFNRFLTALGDRMRRQNGHEHRASVCFLFTCAMIQMRPHTGLDELLLTRCINHHDEPEGITGIDLPAIHKTAHDDLKEYLIFEDQYRRFGPLVWREQQKCFLLQFCLENPGCFPEDAREVMAWLAQNKHAEALFFKGVQSYDYIYYAYECYAERGIVCILHDVMQNQLPVLDMVAAKLPGFREIVWTDARREFFSKFLEQMVPEKV